MSKRTRKLLSLGIAVMSISVSSLGLHAVAKEPETETETTVEVTEPTVPTFAEEDPEKPSDEIPEETPQQEEEQATEQKSEETPPPEPETQVTEQETPAPEPETTVVEPETPAPEQETQAPEQEETQPQTEKSEKQTEKPTEETVTEKSTEPEKSEEITLEISDPEKEDEKKKDKNDDGEETLDPNLQDDDMNLSFVDLDPNLFDEDDLTTMLEDDNYVTPDFTLHSIGGSSEVKISITGFSVDPSKYPAANINQNTKEIYAYLVKEMGLNHAAACGVLANIHLESNFDPLALGDGGTSYGICQWHNERFNRLISYCNSNGFDYNTLNGQLHYLQHELETSYGNVIGYIRGVDNSARGSYDAAYYWCVYFESPSDTIARAQQRGYLAMNNYFGGTYMTADILEKNSQIVQEIRARMEKSKDGREALKEIRARMSKQP